MVTLINARFVPLYFDLGAGSPAADDAAKKFVVAVDPRLGGRSVPTPDVFALRPDGTLLGRESNYASEAKYLAMLQSVVAKSQTLGAETELEKKLPIPRRAWLRYCLGDYAGAKKILVGRQDDPSLLMLACIFRWQGRLEPAKEVLDQCSKKCRIEATIERGLINWRDQEYAQALAEFESIPQAHPRRAEVDYHRGLVLFQLKLKAAARSVWSVLIGRHGENAWSYRADWAIQSLGRSTRGHFSTTGKKSLLGRHGYMGRKNPDLSAK